MISQYVYLLPITLLGLLAVTLIDTLGAWASRKLDFNYRWLAIPSYAVYVFVGYTVSRQDGLLMAIIIDLLIGLYDGTVGLKLALILDANYRLNEEEKDLLTTQVAVFSMMLIAPLMAFIGYLIAR